MPGQCFVSTDMSDPKPETRKTHLDPKPYALNSQKQGATESGSSYGSSLGEMLPKACCIFDLFRVLSLGLAF